MIKTTIDFIGIDGVSENTEFAMMEKADQRIEQAMHGKKRICIDDHVLIDNVICAQFDNVSFRDDKGQAMALAITTEDDTGSIFVTIDPKSEYLEVTICEYNICINVKKFEA